MANHEFLVGQQVLLEGSAFTRAAAVVEIVRHLPLDVHGTPQYRVKASGERLERCASERQLTSAIPASAGVPQS